MPNRGLICSPTYNTSTKNDINIYKFRVSLSRNSRYFVCLTDSPNAAKYR